jgi:hypothetical protein
LLTTPALGRGGGPAAGDVAGRLAVIADDRVLELDLAVAEPELFGRHAAVALRGAAGADGLDEDVGELVLHVGVLVAAGAAEGEDGTLVVLAGRAALGQLGGRLVELLHDGEGAEIGALTGEGARRGRRPRDGLRDAPREAEDLDLALVLGVAGLAIDSVDLEEGIERHGRVSFSAVGAAGGGRFGS